MSEKLAQGEISIYEQGSEYQALFLDAMLQGGEVPVPPYQLVAQVAGDLVVRDAGLTLDVDSTPQDSEPTFASDDYTSSVYRRATKDLRGAQNEAQGAGEYSSLTKIEKYVGMSLEGVCFSPTAVDLLTRWTDGLGNKNSVVGKHAALEAITTAEGMQSVIHRVATAAPHLLLTDIPTLSHLVPQETIREWVDAVSTSKSFNHARAFINNLHKVTDYFEGEDEVLAERVKASLTQMYCTDVINALIRRPTTLQYLTPGDARQITANKLADLPTAGAFPGRVDLDRLVELGLAKPEQIEEVVVDALIANQDAGSSALRDPKDVLSEDGINRVKTTLLEQFDEPVSKDDSYKRTNSLSAIVRCGLFTDEELKGVFETCIERGESGRLLSHMDAVNNVLSPEQTRGVITEAVQNKTAGSIYDFTLKRLLGKVDLDPEVTFELIKQVANRAFNGTSPKAAMQLIEFVPANMRGRLIRDIVDGCPIGNLIYEKSYSHGREDAFAWVGYLGSRSEAATILRNRIEEARGFDFVAHVQNWRSDDDYLPMQLFSLAEARAMVRERIHATNPDGIYDYSTRAVINNFYAINSVLTDPEEVSTLIRERAYLDPEALLGSWKPEFGAYFDPSEVMDMLEAAWPKDMVDKPRVSEELEAFLPQDRLVELYSSYMALSDYEEDVDLGIDDFISRLDPQVAKLFIQKLLDKNPYRLLESNYATDFLDLERSVFIDFINEHTSTFAPKTLGKLNRRYERANPYQQRLLEKDQDDLYQAFAWINHAGLNDTYERLLTGARTEKAERELLHLLSAAGRQIDWYKDTQLAEVKDLRGLRSLVEDVTLHELGIDQLTHEQRTTFRSAVTDILPFGVYASRYAESEQHRIVLKDMLEAAVKPEAYKSWRFALDKTLEERKALGWVPGALSETQFDQWAEDDESVITLGEARNDAVGTDIAELIRQNTEHLGVSEDFSDPETQSRLDELVRKLGQELKEAHAGRKHGTERVNVGEVEGWLKSSKYLRAAHVMYNADRFSGQQIKQVMRDFRAGLPEDGRFLAERVEEMLAFAGTTLEDVVITDISDPQTTIEIGAKPVPSCQHYANGSANENLLGYFDVDVKPIVIKGKNGNIAARAIMRLLETESGEPVLFVEPTYTSYNYGQVSQAIQTFIAQKAAKLGIAYISNDDVNTSDEEEVVIRSRGSRAPERYSDSLEHYDDSMLSTVVDGSSIIKN